MASDGSQTRRPVAASPAARGLQDRCGAGGHAAPESGTATRYMYAVASEVMVTAGPAFPYAPPGWVGGVIMIGYTVALVAGGIVLTKRRDLI